MLGAEPSLRISKLQIEKLKGLNSGQVGRADEQGTPLKLPGIDSKTNQSILK